MNFKKSTRLVLGLLLICLALTQSLEVANNNPNIKIYVEKPVIEELPADSIKSSKDVVEAVPLLKQQPEVVENLPKPSLVDGVVNNQKLNVDVKAAADLNNKDQSSVQMSNIEKPASQIDINKQEENTENAKLPPIPLILPSFLSNLPPFLKSIMESHQSMINQDNNNNFDLNDNNDSSYESNEINNNENTNNNEDSTLNNNNKHGFMSIFLFKSNRKPDQQMQQQDENNNGPKANLLIMKILPRPLIGGDSDPDNQQQQPKIKVHLFGGPSDPDHPLNRQQHLFGGDSDSAERFRFGQDDESNKGMMTGNEDFKMNMITFQQRHESLIDKIKNFFNFNHQQETVEPNRADFIIRTDNGEPAFISNDIGAGADLSSNEQSRKSKCFMMSFMRLKASAYYRTIIHLLFFSGLALFILFAILLTMRTFKRGNRRFNNNRYSNLQQSSMNIASIDSKQKHLSWLNGSKTSDLSSSLLMPQPPPAYDQVLISTDESKQNGKYQTLKEDMEERKSIHSLPPEYIDEQPIPAKEKKDTTDA